MSHLPHSIELHDSEVASVRSRGGAIVIELSPAYIHRDGKGWLQEAELIVGAADVAPFAADFPVRLADGKLKTPGGPYHNLLSLPLKWSGPVSLELELVSGTVIRVKGNSVEVQLLGTPKYLEDVT